MAIPAIVWIAGAIAAAAATAGKKKKSGGGGGGGGTVPTVPTGRVFVNGMPADRLLPDETFAMVNTTLGTLPDPPDADGYQRLVSAIMQAAAMLRQNFPLASDALTARWLILRRMALENGWRERDALDGPQA